MIRRLLAVLSAAFVLAAAASPIEMPARRALPLPKRAPERLVAATLPTTLSIVLTAPSEKELAAEVTRPGPVRVGTVRPLAKAAAVSAWVPAPGGYVAKIRAASTGALGLRVRFDLEALAAPLELRVAEPDGTIDRVPVEAGAKDVWTPWTEGESQVIELFSAGPAPAADAVRVGAIVHFTDSPLRPKSAATCTLETMCAPSDTSLVPGVAAAIVERSRSIVHLTFTDGSGAFVCSGTLINTEKFPAPFVLTANHCIDNEASARSVTSLWLDDSNANCPDVPAPPPALKLVGGAQLVYTNYNLDSTLLRMNVLPPEDALYSGWSNAALASGDAVVSLSHPRGDTARYATGNITREYRVSDWPEPLVGMRFASGIIEHGSSGSGLFSMSGSSLILRGILTGSILSASGQELSCTVPEDAIYSRFDIFEPEIEPFIRASSIADDAPNRPQDVSVTAPPLILDQQPGVEVALDGRRIDYPGDVDIYPFTLAQTAWVSAWSQGANLDTVGNILDSTGVNVAFNDDAQTSDNHFGITKKLEPGRYFVQVMHWAPGGVGPYDLHMRADLLDTNYTDLWWNASESGWGINLNHQGNVIFATLFTYDASGQPMWLVMSDGERAADGSYGGTLYRATGPAFDAQPFSGATLAAVGTMRLVFTSATAGTLTYTFNGTTVTKSITRQVFGVPPTCGWSAFDRSFAGNAQDLWWNPTESGWGVNLTQQGDILFATLFTYARNGQGLWLAMTNGRRAADGSFSGTLYRGSGPRFDAAPWTGVTLAPVGSMTFEFTDGNNGTMTYTVDGTQVVKKIERQVFRALRTECEAP